MSHSSDPSPPRREGSSPLAPFVDDAQLLADLDAILREFDRAQALLTGPNDAVGRLQRDLHGPQPVPPAPPHLPGPAFVGSYAYLLDHNYAAGPGGRTPASSRRGRGGARTLAPELIELRRELLALPPGDPSAAALRHLLSLRSGGAVPETPATNTLAVADNGEQLLASTTTGTPTVAAPSPSSEIDTDTLYASLAEPIRSLALEKYLSTTRPPNRGRLPDSAKPTMPTFYEPSTSVAIFNSVFPLGRAFHRWKDGIRIFVKTPSSRQPLDKRTDDISSSLVSSLLASNIIELSKPGPFSSNFFYVAKDDSTTVRPIVNFSHLSPFFAVPRLVLPSLFQLARKKLWHENLFYCKLDFKQAFFNLPLHPSSRHITNFYYGGKTYRFCKMPFGISVAPYVCQRFLACILEWIKSKTPYCWGHIDDILVAHPDKFIFHHV